MRFFEFIAAQGFYLLLVFFGGKCLELLPERILFGGSSCLWDLVHLSDSGYLVANKRTDLAAGCEESCKQILRVTSQLGGLGAFWDRSPR